MTESQARGVDLAARPAPWAGLSRLRPALWQVVVAASYVAGVGSGWRVLMTKAAPASPLTITLAMMAVTFAGWYAWAFFTYVADLTLFGGHGDYRGTLEAFGRAYAFQALFALTFTLPLGWLWGWVALYATVAAWGFVGPRRLGMRTWQAIVAAALGLIMWLACLVLVTAVLASGGIYLGVGVFLV